ncbi:MAG: DegT/DnrJ/EryC1/StrS family aminotransferase [Bacteroidetes bacterium]|nr:DegT/DnrJ/EryC1/StrS family aminotransferase [Bacteroidota bacterium]MBS1739031.1 DegT/DnrJ/EryC1/StrS family aminotransferase [Bacteroidota bacterium]
MVDLKGQYQKIQQEIDDAVINCIRRAAFINGPEVKEFEQNLATYFGANHVIGCANGTDALQIALMALGLQPGDEVIVPAFTYVATAEVIALLQLKPVMVDVNLDDFIIKTDDLEKYITPKTKAIVPVHLYGQTANMNSLMEIAEKHNLYVIEDNAQAIGSNYEYKGIKKKAGTIGHIGCTSFFPSKNLGCYGDGGALITNDDLLAAKIRMIANHGQKKKYYHSVIGVNSRLDTLQAAILNVKLKYLDNYISARNEAAAFYDRELSGLNEVIIPQRVKNSTHAFHQYTLRIQNGKRDIIQKALQENQIPTMIYYPLPLYRQVAFAVYYDGEPLPHTELLCSEVLSLPIHTELQEETIAHICNVIKSVL